MSATEVLFITTANEPDRIPPALRDRLEIVGLAGYSEAEKVAIAETHLIGAQNRAAGLTETPVRLTRGACRRLIRDYTSEPGVRQLTRCLQAICRKVALGLETGDASLVRERIGARQLRAYLGEPARDDGDGLERMRPRLDAPALPPAVRERGRQALDRLSLWAPADPEHARTREYLACLSSVPWTARSEAQPDLARAKAVLDAGHAGHAAVKEYLLDYIAMRQWHPDVSSPALCLAGPSGVGKTSLARLLAAALGRECAWVACGGLSAAALRGSTAGRPGRIVEELRRVGVRNPLFVLDEVDRLDDAGASAALVELLDPAPGAAFRDHYLDLPLELSEALFVATAADLGSVPAILREQMTVLRLSGYTEAEKRAVATDHLLPFELALHRLTADDVRFTDEAIEALVRGYTRTAGVWGVAGALGAVCGKVVRRRAEGDDALVEVTPATLAGMLGPPEPAGREITGRTGRPGVALGLCRSAAGGGAVSVVEASRMPGSGMLTLTGHQGDVMRESAQTALSWLRANAGKLRPRPGLSSAHRHPCAHSGGRRAEGGGVGRGDDGGRDGIGADGAPVARRRRDDRRDRARRAGAPGRRRQREAARRAPLRAGARHPAAGEPPPGGGARRGPPASGRRRLRRRARRTAGAGAAGRAGGGRRGASGRAGGPDALSLGGRELPSRGVDECHRSAAGAQPQGHGEAGRAGRGRGRHLPRSPTSRARGVGAAWRGRCSAGVACASTCRHAGFKRRAGRSRRGAVGNRGTRAVGGGASR